MTNSRPLPLLNDAAVHAIADLSPQALKLIFSAALEKEPSVAMQILNATGHDPAIFDIKLSEPEKPDKVGNRRSPHGIEKHWDIEKLRNFLYGEGNLSVSERLVAFKTLVNAYASREVERGEDLIRAILFDSDLRTSAIKECPHFFRACAKTSTAASRIFAATALFADMEEGPDAIANLMKSLADLGDEAEDETRILAALARSESVRNGFTMAFGDKAFANAINEKGNNALHELSLKARGSQNVSVARLLELGVDPHRRNDYDKNPLQTAISRDSDVARQLIAQVEYSKKELQQARADASEEMVAYIDAELAQRAVKESRQVPKPRPLD